MSCENCGCSGVVQSSTGQKMCATCPFVLPLHNDDEEEVAYYEPRGEKLVLRHRTLFVRKPPSPVRQVGAGNVMLFNAMCKDKSTFLGCVPQDINGLIRPLLTFVPTCGLCDKKTPQKVHKIMFANDEYIEEALCTAHKMCECFSAGRYSGTVCNVYITRNDLQYKNLQFLCPACHYFFKHHRNYRRISLGEFITVKQNHLY